MEPALPASSEDDGMGRVYLLVIVCHTVVILALWTFGRVFAS